MNITDLSGKTLALLLWKKGEGGLSQDEVSMYFGTLQLKEGRLSLDRGTNGPELNISDEWVERIKIVPDGLKEELGNAEYQLPLTVSDLPEGENADSYNSTGLKWMR